MRVESIAGLCTEVGYHSLNKHGEELCGDHVAVIRPDEDTLIVVLADGLGSGVKASILSTLTSGIISTMVARNMPLEECVSAIAATLPVCSVRGIAYSTFTILRIVEGKNAEIVQYDNPKAILLREGRHRQFPMEKEIIGGKTIYTSRVSLEEGDTFVLITDGVEHAGVGETLNFGWQYRDIVLYLQGMYKDSYTAKTITAFLLEQCMLLYAGKPGDDATVCTVKVRKRQRVNLLVGPPQDPEDVHRMMSRFFGEEGRHIVCGGTSGNLAAQYLGKQLVGGVPTYIDPAIPPTAKIEGVDLVTEGVITLSKVMDYVRDYAGENRLYGSWSRSKDGASLVARFLLEIATDIHFYVGRAVNPAHQKPDLPFGYSTKIHMVEAMVQQLKLVGKHVESSYF